MSGQVSNIDIDGAGIYGGSIEHAKAKEDCTTLEIRMVKEKFISTRVIVTQDLRERLDQLGIVWQADVDGTDGPLIDDLEDMEDNGPMALFMVEMYRKVMSGFVSLPKYLKVTTFVE